MISPQVLDAIRSAPIYDLGQPLHVGMPVHPAHSPFFFSLAKRHGDVVRSDGCSACNDVVIMNGHTGTHLDAIGHIARDGRLHGGQPAAEAMGVGGLATGGVDAVPPLFLRGILADLPGHRGVDRLAGGEAVDAAELAACLARQGVTPNPGDALLVRTGWIQLWDQPHAFLGEGTGTPGPDVSAAHWIADRGLRIVGSDTSVFEVVPPQATIRSPLPVHALLLADHGICIMESLNLEALARDRVYEFLLVLAPLRIVGATGSPLRPLAIPVK